MKLRKKVRILLCFECKKQMLVYCSNSSNVSKVQCPVCFRRTFEKYMEKEFSKEESEK